MLASATAEPPLEPPEIAVRAPTGCGSCPCTWLTEVMPQANSWVCVLPTRIAPAARARRSASASAAGTWSREHRRAVGRADARGVEEVLAPRAAARRAGPAARPGGRRASAASASSPRAVEAERREGAEALERAPIRSATSRTASTGEASPRRVARRAARRAGRDSRPLMPPERPRRPGRGARSRSRISRVERRGVRRRRRRRGRRSPARRPSCSRSPAACRTRGRAASTCGGRRP